MTSEQKPITLGDYPAELEEAYNDPRGDIMWRAGIARAAAILLNNPKSVELKLKIEGRERPSMRVAVGDTICLDKDIIIDVAA